MKSETEISAPHATFYQSLYNELNPRGLLEVDANAAAQFLKKSGLSVIDLSQIWELADYRKKGSLDRLGAFIAFKLVAGVQQGYPIDFSVLDNVSLSEPRFQNISIPTSTSSPMGLHESGHQPPLKTRSASVTSRTSLVGDWDIDPAEQSKYETIFYSLNPINGKLTGEQCRSVLINSKLPQLHLAKIWELSDIDHDGHLDKYEMCIALHLVYKCLENEPLPDLLPVSLIHPMKRVQCSIGSNSSSPYSHQQSQNIRRASSTSVQGVPPPKLPINTNSRTSSVSSFTKPVDENGFQSIFDSNWINNENWPVDANSCRVIFQQIDTDTDDLVNGADARDHLLTYGLSQPILAQIWALVDTAKLGRLNLEQFALIIQLIKEFQNGVRLPDQLPAHLIPPSLRLKTAVSRVSSGGQSVSNLTISMPSNNPRINELTEEIEKAMEARRKAEQDLFQLEADTLVKNSEIKNLEIEVQTMSSTVKQLQNQKGEAGKRLLELDNRIVKLEGICNEHNQRLTAEEDRLNKVKQDIAEANDNFNAEEEQLYALREEANTVDEKCQKSKNSLTEENTKIERLVDDLTRMERQTDFNNRELERVEKLTAELSKLLEIVECAENPDDVDAKVLTDEELVSKQFERIILGLDGTTSPISKVAPPAPNLAFSCNPFKDDPFESTDDSKNGFGTDPFDSRTNAFGPTDDPFSSSTISAQATTNGSEFADFSKFANFT